MGITGNIYFNSYSINIGVGLLLFGTPTFLLIGYDFKHN